jgi:hypothetical protein
MPLAKIHIKDGQYDDKRLNKVSKAIQDALISILGVSPEDFYQIDESYSIGGGRRSGDVL